MDTEQGRMITTEVIQSHSTIRWVLALLIANLSIMVFGGVSIYVNDGNQDKKIDNIQARLLQTPTREEVKLLDKLVLAEIKSAKAINKQTKNSLDRVATAILAMKREIAESKH